MKKYGVFVLTLYMLLVFLIIATISGFAQAPAGEALTMTKQKMQDPVIINPKAINQLFAPDAMQSPGLKQYGPESQLNAKRFWITRFGGENMLKWNISVPEASAYYVDFLINCKTGTKVRLTGAMLPP